MQPGETGSTIPTNESVKGFPTTPSLIETEIVISYIGGTATCATVIAALCSGVNDCGGERDVAVSYNRSCLCGISTVTACWTIR